MKSTRSLRARAIAMNRPGQPSPGTAGPGAAAGSGVVLDCEPESGSLKPSRTRARPERRSSVSEAIDAVVTEPPPQIIGTHSTPAPLGGASHDQSYAQLVCRRASTDGLLDRYLADATPRLGSTRAASDAAGIATAVAAATTTAAASSRAARRRGPASRSSGP